MPIPAGQKQTNIKLAVTKNKLSHCLTKNYLKNRREMPLQHDRITSQTINRIDIK